MLHVYTVYDRVVKHDREVKHGYLLFLRVIGSERGSQLDRMYCTTTMGRVRPRSNKYKETEAALRKAILAYRTQDEENEGKKSLRDVADEYGVAYVTLWRRVRGGKGRVQAHQSEQKLTVGEEKTLSGWICDLDDRGFPPKVEMVSAMAPTILLQCYDDPEMEDEAELEVGKHWISRYLSQHPELVSTFSTQVNKQRLAANELQALKPHFRDLTALMIKYHIDRPSQVYNMDEKGFLLVLVARCKVICRRGRKSPPLLQDMTILLFKKKC